MKCRKRTARYKWLTQGPERKHSHLYLLQIPRVIWRMSGLWVQLVRLRHMLAIRSILTMMVSARFGKVYSTYVIERSFPLTSITNELIRKFSSLRNHLWVQYIMSAEPATLTPTLITSTTEFMPSIPASDATACAQVAAGVSVSVQLRPSHLQV